jgi:hypothetical protein
MRAFTHEELATCNVVAGVGISERGAAVAPADDLVPIPREDRRIMSALDRTRDCLPAQFAVAALLSVALGCQPSRDERVDDLLVRADADLDAVRARLSDPGSPRVDVFDVR